MAKEIVYRGESYTTPMRVRVVEEHFRRPGVRYEWQQIRCHNDSAPVEVVGHIWHGEGEFEVESHVVCELRNEPLQRMHRVVVVGSHSASCCQPHYSCPLRST